MTDEYSVLEKGPSAVLDAVGSNADLNFHALGQACGRESRIAESVEEISAWTQAAISCYERAAAEIDEPTSRQSLMLGAYGLRVEFLIRAQDASPNAARYLLDVGEWLRQGLSPFAFPSECRRALESLDDKDHDSAFLACERLRITSALQRAGHLGNEFDAWFEAMSPRIKTS